MLTPLWLVALLVSMPVSMEMAYSAVSAILAEAYPIFFHAKWGKTLGKMAVGIRVVRTDGSPIGWPEAIFRSAVNLALSAVILACTLVFLSGVDPAVWPTLSWERQAAIKAHSPVFDFEKWVTNLLLAWTLSEVVVMLTNRRRRALHDFIAGTVVIRQRGAIAAVPPPALA